MKIITVVLVKLKFSVHVINYHSIAQFNEEKRSHSRGAFIAGFHNILIEVFFPILTQTP